MVPGEVVELQTSSSHPWTIAHPFSFGLFGSFAQHGFPTAAGAAAGPFLDDWDYAEVEFSYWVTTLQASFVLKIKPLSLGLAAGGEFPCTLQSTRTCSFSSQASSLAFSLP